VQQADQRRRCGRDDIAAALHERRHSCRFTTPPGDPHKRRENHHETAGLPKPAKHHPDQEQAGRQEQSERHGQPASANHQRGHNRRAKPRKERHEKRARDTEPLKHRRQRTGARLIGSKRVGKKRRQPGRDAVVGERLHAKRASKHPCDGDAPCRALTRVSRADDRHWSGEFVNRLLRPGDGWRVRAALA